MNDSFGINSRQNHWLFRGGGRARLPGWAVIGMWLVLSGPWWPLPALVEVQEEQQLVLFCWPGYVPQTVIDAFTKETGIRVLSEYYSTNEELLRYRLVNGRCDLVQPSDYAVEALIKREALQPLRKENIPNLKNLNPEFLGLPHDPEGTYGVPWLAGTVGIVINTDAVKEPIRGLEDVFSGKYKGRIVALNDPREWLGWALCHLELPVNEVTPEVLMQVQAVWQEWMPQIAVFDSDNAVKVMLNGQADIALTWSGDAAKLLANSDAFQYVLPWEGAHRYVDFLAIPQGAPHPESAEKFLDFVLRPDISLMISEAIPFTNPNQRAYEQLSLEARNNPASYPQGDPDLRGFRDLGIMADQVERLFYELRYGFVMDPDDQASWKPQRWQEGRMPLPQNESPRLTFVAPAQPPRMPCH